jgi:hypothetical protein
MRQVLRRIGRVIGMVFTVLAALQTLEWAGVALHQVGVVFDPPDIVAAVIVVVGGGFLILEIYHVLQSRRKIREESSKSSPLDNVPIPSVEASPKPLMARELAEASRRINAARPVVKALSGLFWHSGTADRGWGGSFQLMFLRTCLALPEKPKPWDDYAFALVRLNERFQMNEEIEAMQTALEEYEAAPNPEKFRALAQSIAQVSYNGNAWIAMLANILSQYGSLLSEPLAEFRKIWVPRYNEAMTKMAALREEVVGLGIPFFEQAPLTLAEEDGQFRFV